MPSEKTDSPEFLGPGYDLTAFRRDLTGGRLRWLSTVLAIASAGLFGSMVAGIAPLEMPIPIPIQGPAVLWVAGGALLFWMWVAVVNWWNHRHGSRRKSDQPTA